MNKPYGDNVDGMPVDDDTNYVVMAQQIIEQFDKDFEPEDVANAWLRYQSVFSYFTADRIAYINFLNCIEPPASAMYKNICREEAIISVIFAPVNLKKRQKWHIMMLAFRTLRTEFTEKCLFLL